MFVCKVVDACIEWNGKRLFHNVSFDISEGEHVALFGRNGCGKTTLLHAMAGRVALDGGAIQRFLPPNEWGYLDQPAYPPGTQSVLEFVQSGCPDLYDAKQTLEQRQKALEVHAGLLGGARPQVPDDALEKYSEAYERYVQLGGYDWEIRVEKSLQRVKLEPSLWKLPFGQLSGGQKTRAQIARLMAGEARFILLDEPTNHLDRETLDWLEQWIRDYPGAVLFVSHDRHFLDRAAHSIIELTPQGCTKYTGGYTAYRNRKQLELRTQQALYKKQEQARQELLESIRRYRMWFHKAHQTAGQNDFLRSKAKKNVSRFKAKEAVLERLDKNRVEKPREPEQLNMRLETDPFSSSTLLTLDRVSFAYPEGGMLFRNLNLSVNRGDRIAVIGPNGAGKTSLLKLIVGELSPVSGTIRSHHALKTGYFAQEPDHLREEETILESLLQLPDMTQSVARTILGCFLFSGEDALKTIGELSMGEKCRVAFLKLYFSRAHLLVLDEPTNYLDVDTRERVEDALAEFPGAIIIVSHDRYLIRKIANKLVILGNGEAAVFPGTYDEYAAQRGIYGSNAEEQSRENEIKGLKLRLAQRMTEPEPESEEEKRLLVEDLRRVRLRIAELEAKKETGQDKMT